MRRTSRVGLPFWVLGFVAVLAVGCADADRSPHLNRGETAPEPPGRARHPVNSRPAATSSRAAALPPTPTPTPREAVRDDASLKILQEALGSSDYATRLIALEAIAEARLPEGVEWLAHALGDPEHDVRVTAVDALGEFQWP